MDEDGQLELARDWWLALSRTCPTPLPVCDAHRLLAGLIGDLSASLDREVFDASAGAAAGAALVEAELTDPAVLPVSAGALARLGTHTRHAEAAQRLPIMLASFGQGYGTALDAARRQRRITVEQALTEAQRAADERFRVVFDHAAVAIAIGDTDGCLMDANQCLADMIGVSVEHLRGISVYDFAHPDDRDGIRAMVYDRLVPTGEGTVKLEQRIQRADGTYGWASFAITFVKGAAGQDDYLLAVGEDVTERHRMEDELHWQARHDPLTGLPNRRQLVERLEGAIGLAGADAQVGLCFLDLDGFKHVNDHYGHGAGDRLLTAVAAQLRDSVPGQGVMVSRIGGDEFVALIPPPADHDRVAAVADRLLAALEQPITVGHNRLRLSASIGAVVAPATGTDAEALLDAADTALFRAKADGKGRWVLRAHTSRPGALAIYSEEVRS
ncbi:GGDEF domain-containing protein [Nocardia sp. 2]|uniref:GGDEF domain-containing protein n=1 Tax=Nocardia acididurans TaxID=2802282 RepID=A0ABS1MDD7_9NOCA|nr:sensor domain-containing diguanylate cyclase [Nocardia acididurans]MBL1078632.1 GGDEF domain-containing protein [Nocardia acididurans]